MSKYKLLLKIIEYLDEFENESRDSSIEDFVLFLNNRINQAVTINHQESPDFSREENHDYKNFLEVEFSTLLTNLYRFAKHYVKKAFNNSSFKSLDEFSFLATLLREGSLLKSDLINKHLLEISTGSEVIKRLIKMGLIIELKDETDKRAKRVSLSKKGIKEITESFNEMYKVAQIVRGDMNDDEMEQAVKAFRKLSYFHWGIHASDKNSSLADLHQKYVIKENKT